MNLKERFETNGIIRVAEFHDGDSAAAVNSLPYYDALWASSFTITANNGYPDDELSFNIDRRLKIIEGIVHKSKPIIYDGDTGLSYACFSGIVEKLEDSGIQMVVIEDKAPGNKVNSFIRTKHVLCDPFEFADKIKAGISSRKTDSFLIGARIESFIAGKTMEDALLRAAIYVDSGADAIIIHCTDEKPDQILRFSELFTSRISNTTPIICIPTSYHTITSSELESSKYKMVIYANHGFRGKLMGLPYNKVWESIMLHDRATEIEKEIATMDLVVNYNNTNQEKYSDLRALNMEITTSGYGSVIVNR